MEQPQAAKTVFICYRQLEELLSSLSVGAVVYQRETYNRILDSLNGCFKVDPDFLASIDHLRPVTMAGPQAIQQMRADGVILKAAAHAFIELYLSSEDKKKAIGFNS